MKNPTLRKMIALVLVCVMALCLLAGCGGKENAPSGSGNAGGTGKTDTLKMSFSHHDAATSIWGICFED